MGLCENTIFRRTGGGQALVQVFPPRHEYNGFGMSLGKEEHAFPIYP
ncbi:hypothetical protein KNP414_03665 [Paenibacillus mucilaginosus KNP414]|uniref:Uncharacterized protein n=1 Tax=Paenibacillus mucilaginosus (strain KNP414) TaxID=1036673 RepID=F8FFH6_PAEMK|nr:hypothetical protein KNP414_03665 [Paenibacillus mucilaginosus KNP414]